MGRQGKTRCHPLAASAHRRMTHALLLFVLYTPSGDRMRWLKQD
jgi:hypothetical protein